LGGAGQPAGPGVNRWAIMNGGLDLGHLLLFSQAFTSNFSPPAQKTPRLWLPLARSGTAGAPQPLVPGVVYPGRGPAAASPAGVAGYQHGWWPG
jgi:hypothetical protein